MHQAGLRCSLACGSLVLLCLTILLVLPRPAAGEGAVEAASSSWPSKNNGLAEEQQSAAAALRWPQPRKDTEMYLGRFSLWKSMDFSSLNHQGSKRCKAEVRK